jgi:hypothetical protein
MAIAKTNTMSDLIAVAEIKDLLLSIDAKLDSLNSKIAPAGTVTLQSLRAVNASELAGPSGDLGPESWTEAELKDWVNDLDGVTRYCVENGGMSAQEVWEARRAEEAMKTERW